MMIRDRFILRRLFPPFLVLLGCALLWSCTGGVGAGPGGDPNSGPGPGGPVAAAQPMDTGFTHPITDYGDDKRMYFREASGEDLCKISSSGKVIIRLQGFIVRGPENPAPLASLDDKTVRIFDLAASRYQDTTTKFSGEHGFFSTTMVVDSDFSLKYFWLAAPSQKPDLLQEGVPKYIHVTVSQPVHIDLNSAPDATPVEAPPENPAPEVFPGYYIDGTLSLPTTLSEVPECEINHVIPHTSIMFAPALNLPDGDPLKYNLHP